MKQTKHVCPERKKDGPVEEEGSGWSGRGRPQGWEEGDHKGREEGDHKGRPYWK